MSVYFFTSSFYLLFFLICGTLLCGQVCANGDDESSTNKKIDDFFDSTKISDAHKPDGTSVADEIHVKDYHSLVLVSTKKFLVALAGVNRKSSENKNITVLTKYIDIENENDLESKLFTTPGSGNGEWTKQFAAYDDCKKNDCVGTNVVRGLAAAVKGDKIYIFLANISTKAQSVESCTDLNWCFWLVVNDAETQRAGAPIVWKEEKLKLTGTDEHNDIFKKELSESHLFDSSAFVMGNNKIVFIVKSQLKKEITGAADGSKNVAVVFLLEKGEKQLKLLDVEKTKDFYPTFFQWNEQIFKILPGKPSEGKDKIMVLNDGEKPKFEDAKNSISRLYNFLQNKENFATANFGDKGTVLLFTEQRQVDGGNKKVYLWMTDGTRVSCAGTIVDKIDNTAAFHVSLLYTGNKLFALHQTVKTTGVGEDNNKIEFTLLKDQLQNITNTLSAWRESNDKIENLYIKTATATGINFTDGIVGFLSGDREGTNEKEWKDQYLYVDAEITKPVTNAVKVQDGFKFTGTGAGAQWPVFKREDQRYNFINFGFTLVATVTIGSDTKSADNSILGVGLKDNNYVGLLCTAEGKWVVKDNNSQINIQTSDINCTRNEKYYVALILREGQKIFFYVDGEQIPKSDSEGIHIQQLQNVEYFYFGVDKNTQSEKADVTIENVLLYNRPFEKDKIDKLKHEKNIVDAPQTIEDTTTSQKTFNTSNTATPQDTSATKNREEEPQSSSPPPTTEDSAVRVGVVGVLCFMLFGVFTLLGRYVY